ncbi:MAG: SpoIIIAH-like family protein [Clostridia bacterium]|nr:SpoIIIAH-like family protein [Clostridia bacterium]
MKILKKNQLAILVVSLMLITAGYLSYGSSYNNQTMDMSAKPDEGTGINLAALGDAALVNTNVTEENKQDGEKKQASNDQEQKKEQAQTQTPTPTKTPEAKQTNTNVSKSNDEYFTTSKLERNVMYSQMTTRYQEILSNSTGASDQKSIAQEEINKINDLQNAIMIAENLLTSKGFTKNIIFVNGESISIIIGKEKLEQDEVAQIQNIVSRELKANVENIHISMK